MSIANLNGIPASNIEAVNSIAYTDIANIQGVSLPSLAETTLLLCNFNSQTSQTSPSLEWTPSGSNAWVNGASAISSGVAGWFNDGKAVKGWNLDSGTTPSSNTGPAGALNETNLNGSHRILIDKYMYAETSSPAYSKCTVARMDRATFASMMSNASNNLSLKFWVHLYGSDIGDLTIWIDSASSSNSSLATKLWDSTTDLNGASWTSYYSLWQEYQIDLNAYRADTGFNYIYFVYQGATNYRGDAAIDYVRFVEG